MGHAAETAADPDRRHSGNRNPAVTDSFGGPQRIDVLSPVGSGIQPRTVLPRLKRLLRDPRRLREVVARRIRGKHGSIDWKTLAAERGVYSVIDARHPPEEFDYVTRRQKEILFPIFKRLLGGTEQTVLDFGCGPGRFTGDLAGLINGRAVGCDTTSKLLELAPKHPNVEYVHLRDGLIAPDLVFDVIWISLVLGGISERELADVARKLSNSLGEHGLLFLAEATGECPKPGPWTIRTREQLKSLFPSVALEHVGTYYDAGQEISVLAGRKHATR